MPRPDDARRWLEALYREGDVFEVRVKKEGERSAQQFWLTYERIEQFVTTHLSIHEANRCHVWAGVASRVAERNSTPKAHRVLWCDFSAEVTSVEQAQAAVELAGLPAASMLVWSGNGVHGYWYLDKAYPPEQVAPAARALHALLPADATHDTSRVMRVPGSLNPKGEGAMSYIAADAPERVYPLEAFPQQHVSPEDALRPGATSLAMVPLSEDDRRAIVAAYAPGQRHALAVATAGYLRKSLYYDKASCLAELRRIHEAAGYAWEEKREEYARLVDDTYRRMIAKVAGSAALYELGVELGVTQAPTYTFKAAPKGRIKLIDFNAPLAPQEFWLEGLIGPGLVSLWAAEPKVGKSMAVMQLAHALAFGHDAFGIPGCGSPKRVLYFQGELSQGMVYERAKAMFGLEALKDVRRLAMTDKPAETLSLIDHPEALTDLAEHYDVVIVDPISAFNSNDENSTGSVRHTLSVFDSLKAAGKAVLLVHHTRKLQTDAHGNSLIPSFSDIRGGGYWFGAADAIALQYRLKDSSNCRVRFEFRAAPPREELTLYRLPHGGFTHDKDTYLATLPNTLAFDVSAVN